LFLFGYNLGIVNTPQKVCSKSCFSILLFSFRACGNVIIQEGGLRISFWSVWFFHFPFSLLQIIALWLRRIHCKRNGGSPWPSNEEGEPENVWCSQLDLNREVIVSTSKPDLDQLWTVIVAIFSAGALIGVFSAQFFLKQLGR
jgi:Sugar (and other) transporter